MRPAGEISLALLQALEQLVTPVRAATLQEAAAHAQVGVEAARRAMDNLRRGGRVCAVRTRRVPGRNRPVAEWALPVQQGDAANDAVVGLATAMRAWG